MLVSTGIFEVFSVFDVSVSNVLISVWFFWYYF